MKQHKVVIFDVDGTLVDSGKARAAAWQDTFREFGFDIPFDGIRAQIGKGSDELMKVFLRPEDIQRAGSQIANRQVEVFKRDYQKLVRPFPRIRKLFKRIKEDGHRIVLGTSARREELDAYFRMIDVEDLVDGHTCADDAARSKRHADIFQASLAKVEGARPEQAVVIGDTPYDAEAARKGGMTAVGVLCGGFSEQQLREAGCVAIFEDIEAMLARYDDLPLQPGPGTAS